jgi:SAM pointed domain-containing ETS transcription factor
MGVTLSIVAGPAPVKTTNAPVAAIIGMASAASPASSDGDEADDDDLAAAMAPPPPPRSSSSSSSSSIHLWQFVKELLNHPAEHSACIHWLDRGAGIFKIVDSTRVATLWGQRKNRPAMNYDKLSRSLRQYYKKGIMKKTERTQRLIYQFCAPYHL